MQAIVGLILSAPRLIIDSVPPVTSSGGSNFTQILTVSMTGIVAAFGAWLAWDTERRRRKEDTRKPQGWQEMRDTIRDLRQERDELKADLKHERESHEDHGDSDDTAS